MHLFRATLALSLFQLPCLQHVIVTTSDLALIVPRAAASSTNTTVPPTGGPSSVLPSSTSSVPKLVNAVLPDGDDGNQPVDPKPPSVPVNAPNTTSIPPPPPSSTGPGGIPILPPPAPIVPAAEAAAPPPAAPPPAPPAEGPDPNKPKIPSTSLNGPSSTSTTPTSTGRPKCKPASGQKLLKVKRERRDATALISSLDFLADALETRDDLQPVVEVPPPGSSDKTFYDWITKQKAQVDLTKGATGTTAIFSSTGATDPFTWTSGELSGCTVLYIASQGGVYFSHFWENLAFATDPGQGEPDFKLHVLDFLDQGDPKAVGGLGEALAPHSKQLNGQGLQVHVYTPDDLVDAVDMGKKATGGPLYADLINQLNAKVAQLFGTAPTVHTYTPPETQDTYDDKPRQAIVQYTQKQTEEQPSGLIRCLMGSQLVPDVTFATNLKKCKPNPSGGSDDDSNDCSPYFSIPPPSSTTATIGPSVSLKQLLVSSTSIPPV